MKDVKLEWHFLGLLEDNMVRLWNPYEIRDTKRLFETATDIQGDQSSISLKNETFLVGYPGNRIVLEYH